MALRTTEDKVKEVLSTSLDALQIVRFITDANLWVNEELLGQGFSSGRLELIERYLACALIRMRDMGLKSAKFDDISEQYQVDPDLTEYMTQAAAFDSSGKIRKAFMAPKNVRTIEWRAATPYTEETAG